MYDSHTPKKNTPIVSTPRWAMSEDLPTRFIAYGWNVLRVGDANDVEVRIYLEVVGPLGKGHMSHICHYLICICTECESDF